MIKNQKLIKKIATEMGGTIEEIIPERKYFCINIRGEKLFVSRKFEIASDFFSGKTLTECKDLTYIALKENNLPTPKSVCFYKKSLVEEELDKKLSSLSYPLVIKDAKGSNSKGVFTNIKNLESAKETIMREIKNFSSLIVQEMVFGKEYRVLILKDKAIGVLEMIPPRIFGDGTSTIKKLIEKKQSKKYKKTDFDEVLNEILHEQNADLDSIPAKDQEIFIKKNSCLAEGGETKDVTSMIHPEAERICAAAAKAVGKYLVGIDLICENINKDPKGQTFSILEVNGKPDLYIHYNPTHGETKNVVKDIIEFILELKS
jgi:D-alanine-D-alanine ligase-like ATP-grasp enzyme